MLWCPDSYLYLVRVVVPTSLPLFFYFWRKKMIAIPLYFLTKLIRVKHDPKKKFGKGQQWRSIEKRVFLLIKNVHLKVHTYWAPLFALSHRQRGKRGHREIGLEEAYWGSFCFKNSCKGDFSICHRFILLNSFILFILMLELLEDALCF